MTTRREQITRDYLGGMTVRQLAEKYGRTYGGVQTSLWQWGVKLPAGERIKRSKLHRRPGCESWVDCPTHLREDYKTLRKYMSAREARETLENAAHPKAHVSVDNGKNGLISRESRQSICYEKSERAGATNAKPALATTLWSSAND